MLDAEARVETSDAGFLAALATLYRPAVRRCVGELVAYRYEGSLDLRERGDARLLAPGPVSAALAHALLFGSLAGRVRSHLLLHAAALRAPAGGVLIAGDSGSGKTTLALSLALRGFGLYSDEVGALSRRTGSLRAFPRGALLRAGTLELLPSLAASAESWALEGDDAAACWHPAERAHAAPVRRVFLLGGGERGGEGVVRVAVSDLTPRLAAALRAEPGLAGASVSAHRECVSLEWEAPLGAEALARWSELCGAEGVRLLNAWSAEARPTFARAATLEPRGTLATAMRLSAGAWNRGASAGEGGVAARTLWEVTRALRGARCYALRPGPLDETAALVSEACRRSGGRRRAGVAG